MSIPKEQLLLACSLAENSYLPGHNLPAWIRKMMTVLCENNTVQASLYFHEGVTYCAIDGTGSLLTLDGLTDMRRNATLWRTGWWGVSAHSGYVAAAQEISLALEYRLEELIGRGGEVVFIGHSAGGAIAHLLAIEYACACITFGEPRVGTRFSLNSESHRMPYYVRVQNASDLVPRQPMWLLGYGHQTKGCEHIYLPILLEANHIVDPSFAFMMYDRAFLPVGRRIHDHGIREYHDALEKQYADPAKA